MFITIHQWLVISIMLVMERHSRMWVQPTQTFTTGLGLHVCKNRRQPLMHSKLYIQGCKTYLILCNKHQTKINVGHKNMYCTDLHAFKAIIPKLVQKYLFLLMIILLLLQHMVSYDTNAAWRKELKQPSGDVLLKC